MIEALWSCNVSRAAMVWASVALIAVSTPVRAEPDASPPREPRTACTFQVGLGIRYGALLSELRPTPWGVGLGLTAGYTLSTPVYLGANLEIFYGGFDQERPDVRLKSNIWQVSAEGGYDFALDDALLVRPKLGFGIARLTTSFDGCPASGTCLASIETQPLIAPGLAAMVWVEKVSFVLDVRYALVLTQPKAEAFIVGAGVGF